MPGAPPLRAPRGLRPASTAPLRGGRPLKRWTYLGVFGEEVQACFGAVAIGGLPQRFWATWDGRALREHTSFRPGLVRVTPEGATAPGVAALEARPVGEPVEVLSRHGRQEIWTRKLPVRVTGDLAGRRVEDVPGLVDESLGWHDRVTRWSWCAGAGTTAAGRACWWNLVSGVHDHPAASECTVWVGARATEVGPVAFDGLRAVGGLRFAGEAVRARHDRLWLLQSRYQQPFGRFSGTLPDGTALRAGRGVMERHDARW